METFRFSPIPSAEETAAITAAIEQFLCDTAPPPPAATDQTPSRWKLAALAEGVDRMPDFATWL